MYIPRYYRVEDAAELLAFMRANSFATLVSSHPDGPLASHLPFVLNDEPDALVLASHMARANPHWKLLAEGAPALVIFQRPHAYVTPDWYASTVSVPTWNYAVVHAYGTPRLLEGPQTEAVVTRMIAAFQSSYRAQYDGLPPDFRRSMLNGIVAFEIAVTRLEGKYKLSQNKTPDEQHRVASALQQASDPAAIETGALMAARLAEKTVSSDE